MNPNEHELQYPWADAPALGTWLTLRPGVHWVRMPLPFALDHINLWVLDDEIEERRGYTLIDCGITSDATKQAWERLFDGEFGGKPLLRVLCTHFHPDHFGLAHWLTAGGDRQRWSAPLWMTATEYAFGRYLSADGGDNISGESAARHFARNGLSDGEALQQVRVRGSGYYPGLVPAVPSSFHRIHEGDEIAVGPAHAKRIFRIIVGFGHAPEHASLYCEDDRLLVAGDMVLPRISTNISVFDLEPDADPLPRYLRSLDRLLLLPADTLVLPSHGKPFIGLHQRIGQQHRHHADRLDEVLPEMMQPYADAISAISIDDGAQIHSHRPTFMKPMVVSFLAGNGPAGVPSYRSIEEGVRALAHVAKRAAWLREPPGRPRPQLDVDPRSVAEMLEAFRITPLVCETVSSADLAVAAARKLGMPVALKASEHPHRIDLGAVRLNLADDTMVANAYQDLERQFGSEVIVQAMAPPGVACVIEVIDDPAFGPVVGFGLGGPVTELVGDRAWRAAPLTDRDAAALVRAPKAAPLLAGVDLVALEELLMRVGQAADEVRWLTLNPVLAHETGWTILHAAGELTDSSARPDAGPRQLGSVNRQP